jgi:hypothetical protein
MKITAISSDANLQRYGYKHTRLIEGKLSKNLRNLIKASIARYQYHFYYMIKYDYSKLKQFDTIILTTPPNMPNYSGAMFTGSVYPFLLVAEAYQIPVITFHAIGSRNFFYTTNKKSTRFSSTTDFSEIVNELGLTKDSSVLLVHPAENTPFLDCNPIDAIQFFKEYYENH